MLDWYHTFHQCFINILVVFLAVTIQISLTLKSTMCRNIFLTQATLSVISPRCEQRLFVFCCSHVGKWHLQCTKVAAEVLSGVHFGFFSTWAPLQLPASLSLPCSCYLPIPRDPRGCCLCLDKEWWLVCVPNPHFFCTISSQNLGYQLGTPSLLFLPSVPQGGALGVVSKEFMRMKIKFKDNFVRFYSLWTKNEN